MKLIFIRHAETQTNVNNLTHKTGDPAGLTEVGTRQAMRLVKLCQNEKLEMIFSSPEQRAIETARIIADQLKIKFEILPGLAERNLGLWAGQPWSEIEKVLNPMSLEERFTFVPPEGESWQHMEARLDKCLHDIVESNYQAVGIVTHEGTLRGLMPIVKNAPRESSFNYHFDLASVSIFDYVDGKYLDRGINNASHLE